MSVEANRAAGALRSLVQRYGLPGEVHEKLAILLGLIVDDPMAPTTVRQPFRVINDHFADSLVALELDAVRRATVIADLGSGAGFPGLPLALALPSSEVLLLDASARKAAFLDRLVEACGIPNAHGVHVRAESWTEGIGRFDLVTARALAPLDVVAEYAAPLLRRGGSLAAWRGRRDAAAEQAGQAAAAVLGLAPAEIRPVMPYPGAQHRHIHLMTKVGRTPERFPRRPGMARKRPLGGSRPPV
ncbi:MAG: 16S rRNA (guanine(527)-N(7))-methyltransferase RsmG [Solirubrobacteraceae bacterium]